MATDATVRILLRSSRTCVHTRPFCITTLHDVVVCT